MNYNRMSALVAAALALTGLSAPTCAALVQFTYTGTPFDSFSTGYPFTKMSIEFTVDDMLVPKNDHFYLQSDSPSQQDSPFKSLSYSDGYHVVDKKLPPDYGWGPVSVSLITDADGNISQDYWEVAAWLYHNLDGFNSENTYISSGKNAPSWGYSTFDQLYSSSRFSTYGARSSGNGTWTRILVPTVPIPGGFLLFGSALGALCFNRRLS